jgi:hypothetical protein
LSDTIEPMPTNGANGHTGERQDRQDLQALAAELVERARARVSTWSARVAC